LDAGARFVTCDLGYDALTRAKDNASMYLSIIRRFSRTVWLVYVTGLNEIADCLLKWLAEYTKQARIPFTSLSVSRLIGLVKPSNALFPA